jgi:hypothetical protein
MVTALLLKTLLELEQAIGRASPLEIRRVLMEAQLLLLGIQKEQIALLMEIHCLRELSQRLAESKGIRVYTSAAGESSAIPETTPI